MLGKFRVWDKNGNHLIKNDEPVITTQDGRGYLTMMSTGALGLFTRHANCKFPNVSHLELLNPETHIVQHFTGILDRKGKDIYEGDILSLRLSNLDADDNNMFFEVKYSPGKIIFENIKSGTLLNIDQIYIIYDSYCALLTVVGNIYENPELLK